MTRTVAVVTAGLSDPSSTRLLADLLAAAVVEATSEVEPVETVVVELRPLAHALTDHLLTGFATGDLAAAQRTVSSADAVIAVTPVFSASYSGLFKMFFDVMESGALDGTPVLVAATAGSARHSLVLEHALRPLFSYLHAVVVPTVVFAASEDFGSGALQGRVDRAAGELVALLSARRQTVKLDQFDRDLASMGNFEDLLKG
ncbi:MAG: NADPH-dependent reductase [Marmoricola sp.]|nr:NADPH-dependent reductase [Marmoricola sp.]